MRQNLWPNALAKLCGAALNVLCGVNSAYCERGTVSQDFFDLTSIYYHRLQWVDDFKEVKDQILKFAPTVPEEKTYEYHQTLGRDVYGGSHF